MDITNSSIQTEADFSAYVRFLCLNGKQMGFYEIALLDVFLHSEDVDAHSDEQMEKMVGDDYMNMIESFRERG